MNALKSCCHGTSQARSTATLDDQAVVWHTPPVGPWNDGGMRRAARAILLAAILAGCAGDDPQGFEAIKVYEEAFPSAPYLYPNLGEGERIQSLRALNLRSDGEPQQLELTISNQAVSGRELAVCLSQPDVGVIPGSLNACIFPAALIVDGVEIRADVVALEKYGLSTAGSWSTERPSQ